MSSKSAVNDSRGKILIVDDTLENLEVLEVLLAENGYEVRRAINGQMALMGVEADPPDLILLDIMMPDLDGYEVCYELKRKPETWDIPVIFVSALDDQFDKVRAFEVGAVDYVTKPLQAVEVLARVENQLSISRLQALLQQKNSELERQNQWLQDDLEDRSQRITSLREMEEMYRHMFENAVIGIFQSSPEGVYFKVNDALAQIYGYASAEDLMMAEAETRSKIPYVDPNHWQTFRQIMEKEGVIRSFRAEVYRADGSQTTILESARPVKNDDGALLYYEGFVQEVS